MMKMSLRNATPADYEQVAFLYAEPQRFYSDISTGADEFIKEFKSEDYFSRERYDSYLADEKGSGIIIAEVDGKMAGILCHKASGFFANEDGTTRPLPQIEQFSVNKEFRGKGIGAALMNEYETRMKAEGFVDSALDVMINNPARGMYEDIGYKVVDRAYDKILDRTPAEKKLPSNLQLAFASAADWPAIEQMAASAKKSAIPIRGYFDDTGLHTMDRAAFDKAIATPGEAIILAKENGVVKGFAHAEIEVGTQADRVQRNLCHMFNLEASDKKVFGALIGAVEGYAREHDVKALRAYADAADTERQDLLKAEKFQQPFRQFMSKTL